MNNDEVEWKILIYQNKQYDNYEISTEGRIRNYETKYVLSQTEVYSRNKTSKYLCSFIGLGKRGKTKAVIIHRAVAETFIKNPSDYKYVLLRIKIIQMSMLKICIGVIIKMELMIRQD